VHCHRRGVPQLHVDARMLHYASLGPAQPAGRKLRQGRRRRAPQHGAGAGSHPRRKPLPDFTGTVVLDLKRMDRVIDVDEKNHYALVEPGVSYFDLYRHIRDRGLEVPPPPQNSTALSR
jgi:FAD/FMN-containing dehydrogenase